MNSQTLLALSGNTETCFKSM